MMKRKSNTLLFWLILFVVVIISFEIIGYAGMWLNSRNTDFLSNKNYFRIREMLMGNKDAAHLPRYLSLPYLGYIPYPGYTKGGILQHNEDGYRGNRIPVSRNKKLRILCMGGSTTYGFGVDSPSQTFPAQLEILLNDFIPQDSILSTHYTGAEVLNAGLEAGTSAEELEQYLFKYSYYRPDIVVVNSGVNDAQVAANASEFFQYDYTHYRRLNFHLEPLAAPARWMLRSWFFSYLSIRLFYNDFSGRRDEFAQQKESTFPHWSNTNLDSLIRLRQYIAYPFYTNTRRLFAQVIADSALLVVVPNILNRHSAFEKEIKNYSAFAELNVSLSKQLAEEAGAMYVPFTFDSIKNPAWWIDDCHLTAEGEANKAQVLLPVVLRAAHMRKR
jgi:lysophospholipase L1-like esterase